MGKEETQEPDKGQEVKEEEKEEKTDEQKQNEEYSEEFSSIVDPEKGTKKKAKKEEKPEEKAEEKEEKEEEPPPEEKDEKKEEEEGAKDKEEEEGAKDKEEEEKKEEKPEETPAKDAIDEAGKRYEERLGAEGKTLLDDGSIVDTKKGEKEKREVSVEPIKPEQVKEVFEKLDLTDDEKKIVEDDPELVSIMGKFASALFNAVQGGVREVKLSDEEKQGVETQLNALRDQIQITEEVPDWKKIAFEQGGKIRDKDGNRIPNKALVEWVSKEPKMVKALYQSPYIEDNIAVLQYYKEHLAKEQVSEKDKEAKEKADKEKSKLKKPDGSKKIDKKKEKKDGTIADYWGETKHYEEEGIM